MSTTICKKINSEFSADNLEDSQKHILNPIYKNKLREVINNAIDNGDDISLDDEGNVLCLQTKFYVRKYEWDRKIQDFIKVRTQGRRARKRENNQEEFERNDRCERIEEFMEE